MFDADCIPMSQYLDGTRCPWSTCSIAGCIVPAVAGADHEAHPLRLVAPSRLPHNRREVALQQSIIN